MGFITRLKNVAGKEAREREAQLEAEREAGLAEAEALLDSEMAERPEVRQAKAKVKAMMAAGNSGGAGGAEPAPGTVKKL